VTRVRDVLLSWRNETLRVAVTNQDHPVPARRAGNYAGELFVLSPPGNTGKRCAPLSLSRRPPPLPRRQIGGTKLCSRRFPLT